jgi:TetR/AcrR family transcriptional repressor of mexJK operon
MAAGELRRDDPVFAARMLLAMLAESERTQRLFSGEITPPHDEAEVERILDLFLRAYAPTPT